jgi:hypothetical protein
MARQRFEAEVPDGMRLGFAQGSEGGMRGLLFDEETNKLVGHAKLFEAEDDDDWRSSTHQGSPSTPPQRDEQYDEFIAAISEALAHLVLRGVGTAAPHVRQWWQDKAAPAFKSTQMKVKSTLKRTTRSKKTDDGIVTGDMVTLNDTEPSDPSNQEDAGLDAIGPTMSSAEARQRFTDAVVAMAFAREQMRRLHNARISDDDGPSELASTLKELSPQRVGEAIHLMLEAEPSMLHRKNLVAFKTSLVTAQLGGDLVPLGNETPEELLRLAEGEQ